MKMQAIVLKYVQKGFTKLGKRPEVCGSLTSRTREAIYHGKLRIHENKHTYVYTYVYTQYIHTYPWCHGYRRRKWTPRDEFKPLTKLIAFHIVLIPFGKGMNLIILPTAMGRIVGQTEFFSLSWATIVGEGRL